MELLTSFPDDKKIYRGTIIILKDLEITPKGNFDIIYCLVNNNISNKFNVLDLFKSMGSCIIYDLEPNVKGHFAVDKQGIYNWVKKYFELFYTKKVQADYIPRINDFLYIENLSDYFTQANRDLFMK